jgi:hypothetical protein
LAKAYPEKPLLVVCQIFLVVVILEVVDAAAGWF